MRDIESMQRVWGVGIFLTVALYSFAADPVRAAVADRLEASVNSSIILLSDLRRFRDVLKLRAQLDPLFAGTPVAAKGTAATDLEIVEFLINERLISQQFQIPDTEVEQEINSIQSNNHIDRTALKSALKEQGFSFDDYFDLIRASVSKRNLIDRDIRTKVTISDDDIKNYFYNHYSRNSAIPIAYHMQLISVSTKSFKSSAAAREAAERALQALKAGEAFDEVAKRASDHPTASTGGDLGTLTDDQMAPAIREQVKGLKIGQVSPVFGTAKAGGFYIIKLVDVKSSYSDRYEKAKDEIRNQLYAGEYQHQIQLWIERQRQSAFIHRAGEQAVAGIPPIKK